MEDFSLKLKDALAGKAGVYLGPEELAKQPALPHIIVVPAEEDLTPPTDRQNAADAALEVDLNCRANTYTEARALALKAWRALRASADPDLRIRQEARIRYGTDTWGGGRVARVAQLTVTIPAPVPRADTTLVRLESIGQHVRYDELTFKEVPRDPQDNPGTGSVQSDFHEHDDPQHRFGGG